MFADLIPRPDPAQLDLPLIDTYCAHFLPTSCNLVFEGSFCTGQDLVSGQETEACMPVCESISAFLENKLSNQNSAITCGSVHTENIQGVAGRKEECGLECPDIRCDETNLANCTHVKNRLRGCQGGFEGAVLCRAPDSDPPQLAAGGVLATMNTRRTIVELNPAASSITFGGQFAGELSVSGRLDLLGETCVGCAASIHLSAFASGVSIQQTEIDQIHLSAGTGTAPVVAIDANGHGSVSPNAMDGTLSMRINGVPQFLTTRNTTGVDISFDRVTRAFTLDGDVTAERDGVVASGHLHLVGEMTNQPPTVAAPEALSLECSTSSGTPVTLHATTTDPDGPLALLGVGWDRVTDGGASESISAWFDAEISAPLGVSDWRFWAIDRGLQSHSATTRVTVRDSTPPVVTLSRNLCLWPVNHKYVVLDVQRDLVSQLRDTCDEEPSVRIIGATSNEPDDDRGDGHSESDIVVVDDQHVCLRAERSGLDTGRVYSIELEVSDSSGNRSRVTQQVVVPHDQGRQHCNSRTCGRHVDDDDVQCQPAASTLPPPASRSPYHGCETAPGLVTALAALMLARVRRRK